MSNETQLLTEDLEVGSFYWLRVLNDQDAEDWEMKPMPARYSGNGKWNFLGVEGEAEWKVWVLSKIENNKVSHAILKEELLSIIDGIDEEETYSDTGWWETSRGSEFGANVKAKLLALFDKACPLHVTAA